MGTVDTRHVHCQIFALVSHRGHPGVPVHTLTLQRVEHSNVQTS